MASQTESKLAQRGKNKAGKHHLRQIGLGLQVARDSRLPLHYSVYPDNIHDSRHFKAIMDEMFGIIRGLNKTKERLTVVIDKDKEDECLLAYRTKGEYWGKKENDNNRHLYSFVRPQAGLKLR